MSARTESHELARLLGASCFLSPSIAVYRWPIFFCFAFPCKSPGPTLFAQHHPFKKPFRQRWTTINSDKSHSPFLVENHFVEINEMVDIGKNDRDTPLAWSAQGWKSSSRRHRGLRRIAEKDTAVLREPPAFLRASASGFLMVPSQTQQTNRRRALISAAVTGQIDVRSFAQGIPA